jgi:hypothetical protein
MIDGIPANNSSTDFTTNLYLEAKISLVKIAVKVPKGIAITKAIKVTTKVQ